MRTTSLPRRPIKIMLITMTVFALAGAALIIWAVTSGTESRIEAGYPILRAALLIFAPGALIISILAGFTLLVEGQIQPIDDVTYVIFSCIVGTFLYGMIGLWIGVVLERRKKAVPCVPASRF